MKGRGRGWGAITIVNALAGGTGCAAAIALPVEATVDLEPGAPRHFAWSIDPVSDTPIVRATLEESLRSMIPEGGFRVRAEVRSTVPTAKGLKSSSAVGVALVRAVATALGRDARPTEAARITARAARQAGLSATGAFDDAIASSAGGIVVARNGPDEVVHAADPDPGWRAVVWVPPTSHAPSTRYLDTFREHRAEGLAAAETAIAGDYLTAMELNSRLVERLVGYEYAQLRIEVAHRGALASGVSGMGPSLAAIVPKDRASDVAAVLPSENGQVLVVDFVRRTTDEPPRADA